MFKNHTQIFYCKIAHNYNSLNLNNVTITDHPVCFESHDNGDKQTYANFLFYLYTIL